MCGRAEPISSLAPCRPVRRAAAALALLRRVARDERGDVGALSYLLILTVMVVPLWVLVPTLKAVLEGYQSLLGFTIALPFP